MQKWLADKAAGGGAAAAGGGSVVAGSGAAATGDGGSGTQRLATFTGRALDALDNVSGRSRTRLCS